MSGLKPGPTPEAKTHAKEPKHTLELKSAFLGDLEVHAKLNRLAVFQPADDFGEVGLFAVHQDADAVDTARDPERNCDG